MNTFINRLLYYIIVYLQYNNTIYSICIISLLYHLSKLIVERARNV